MAHLRAVANCDSVGSTPSESDTDTVARHNHNL
jgi:hypothetical protein